MSYKVVIDSCGELTPEMKASGHFATAPLELEVDGYFIRDDETFDQADFLRRVAQSPNGPKSACPSPEEYMAAFDCEAERVYAVTLSARLSGSYNSAVLGMNLYREEHGEKDIYVFNSRSASVGQSLIGMKIQECEEAGMTFSEVIDTVEAYIETQHTYFVLESLDTLRKNGRLSGIKAMMASALNIKPVMGSTPEGAIAQLAQARGMKKALVSMADRIRADGDDFCNRILAICHCNNYKRAEYVRDLLLERMKVKDVFIVNARGVTSMYANDGGIVVVL